MPRVTKGRPGGGQREGKQPTLRDVAEHAGVHISTASRALDETQIWRLSDATVKRVRKAVAELGYRQDLVAVGLKRGQTKTVGVVVADLENPYNALLIRGIARTLEEAGFIALVAETAESRSRFERILTHLAQRRVDAIITAAAHLGDEDLVAGVVAGATPTVLAVRDLPQGQLPAVVHDDESGGAVAAEHFAEFGHQRVAQLAGPADIDTFARRMRGFRESAKTHELTDLTVEENAEAPTQAEGRRMMEAVLALDPRPTAVFAPSDVMAVGALEAIAAARLKCPRDVSVIGYNDVPLSSQLTPPLTTVRLPSEEVGRQAGRLALDLIAHPEGDRMVVRLPAELVKRRSVGPPRS